MRSRSANKINGVASMAVRLAPCRPEPIRDSTLPELMNAFEAIDAP